MQVFKHLFQTPENKVASKSKPKMKAGKEAGKEVMRPKKEGQKVADKQARIALGSGDVNKVKLIELLDMSTGSV